MAAYDCKPNKNLNLKEENRESLKCKLIIKFYQSMAVF